MSKRQFDIIQAGFYLVAFVIGMQVLMVLIAELACLWHLQFLVIEQKTCGPEGQLGELLGAALASALAFAGGRVVQTTAENSASKKSEPNPDDPDGV